MIIFTKYFISTIYNILHIIKICDAKYTCFHTNQLGGIVFITASLKFLLRLPPQHALVALRQLDELAHDGIAVLFQHWNA